MSVERLFKCASWIGVVALAASLTASILADSAFGQEEQKEDVSARVAQLIRDLDADRFSIRQLAHERLIEIGDPALPQVVAASASQTPETKYRAKQIVRSIQHRSLRLGFSKLAEQPDEQIDLETGMWLIARIVHPEARRDEMGRQLDELAARVRKRLGDGVEPSAANPRQVVEALSQVLFVEQQFTGNAANYDDPDNSSLDRVLATRKGLPILLSHVVIAVTGRLKVPIVGLAMPGRYMVKYDGSLAPDGFAKDDIIIDPYGGTILSVDELPTIIPGFDRDRHLRPDTKRSALTRMLRNLATDLAGAQQFEKAEQAEEFHSLLDAAPKAR
jgi:regulator of sirC expression with transglutaminase-like and TPR domain